MSASRWRVGLTVAAFVTAAACGQQSEQAQAGTIDWAERVPTDAPARLRTVLEDAVVGPDAPGRDAEAREVAIRDCMVAKGFLYELEPTGVRPADMDLPLASYAAVPASYAEQYGYGLSTFISATEMIGEEFAVGVTPENADFARQADGGEEAWIEGLHAVPAGCLWSTEDVGVAEGEQPEDLSEPDEELVAVYHESFAELEESPEMLEALTAWQSCMADLGFDQYQSRQDIIDEIMAEAFEGNPRLAQVQEREQQLAAADVACAAPVVQAGHQVLAEVHARAVRDHAVGIREALATHGIVVETELLESMQPEDVVTSY